MKRNSKIIVTYYEVLNKENRLSYLHTILIFHILTEFGDIDLNFEKFYKLGYTINKNLKIQINKIVSLLRLKIKF